MYSRMQFAALELMCRERAALAKKEMEYALFEYWLAEAEESKEFKELSDPFIERIANRSSVPSELEKPLSRMTRDGRRLSPREYSHASGLADSVAL
jgi:hypothetical protein